MAMKKKGVVAKFQRHYDKVIVVAVLVGLFGTFAMSALSTGENRRDSARFQKQLSDLRPAHPEAQALDEAPLKATQKLLEEPFAMVAATNLPFLVAEERVWCVECRQPIPYGAEVCASCKTKQPPDEGGADDGWDSDGDGMPDAWELKYKLDPYAADADQDADGDGFSNLEEFRAGTNPNDPASHPPRIEYLRIADIKAQPFPFVLKSKMGLRYQINANRAGGQTYTISKGEELAKSGWILSEATTRKGVQKRKGMPDRVVDLSVIVLTKDGADPVELVEGEAPPTADFVVSFVCIRGEETKCQARKGESFEFDGEKYTVSVIDGARKTVTISRESDKKEFNINLR